MVRGRAPNELWIWGARRGTAEQTITSGRVVGAFARPGIPMEDLKGKRDAVVTTIASLQGKDSPQTKTQPRRATRSDPSATIADLTGLEVDLNGAPNLFERLVRIAKVVDGRTINVDPGIEIPSLDRRVRGRLQEFECGRGGDTEKAARPVQENSSGNLRVPRRRGGERS